jgi:hypothetical protein
VGAAAPDLRLFNFRWRNDDGSEDGATFAVSTNALLDQQHKRKVRRLRIQIANVGQAGTTSQFRLQSAPKPGGACSTIGESTWLNLSNTVTAAGGFAWGLVNTGNVSHISSTTDVSTGGGLANGATSFTAGNFISLTNLTNSIVFSADTFTELEYSLWPEDPASDGSTYCFRVIDATGNSTITYTQYPTITLLGVGLRPKFYGEINIGTTIEDSGDTGGGQDPGGGGGGAP